MTKRKVMIAMNNFQKALIMLDHLLREKHMAKASIFGRMEIFTMVFGN